MDNDALIGWAESVLVTGDPEASIERYERAPSRVGQLYRLFARTSHGETRAYLKIFDPTLTPSGAISDLQTISHSFGEPPGLAFVKVIGALPESGAVLLEEANGIPLSAFRNQALARVRIRELVEVWNRAGRWLAQLHWQTAPPRHDANAPSQTAEYVTERLSQWASLDAQNASIAKEAIAATQRAARDVGEATLVPCHGDVSAGNIIVGPTLTFIDFDDLRFDLPGLDLSQAVMETREFGRVASLVPIVGLATLAERAFRSGYGEQRWPTGAAWLLPHIRNLAVYLITLAPHRHELAWRSRYRRTRAELLRSLRRTALTDR